MLGTLRTSINPISIVVRQFFKVAFSAILVAVFVPVIAAATVCDIETARLKGDWGKAVVSVEVADTPEDRARGLMYRESMPRNHGMIFFFEQPGPVGFWMKKHTNSVGYALY